jgi:hypothetical protein
LCVAKRITAPEGRYFGKKKNDLSAKAQRAGIFFGRFFLKMSRLWGLLFRTRIEVYQKYRLSVA